MSAPCSVCGHHESRVTRTDGNRRRRECTNCRHRWTTVEVDENRLERAEKAAKAVRALAADLAE